MNSKVLSKAGSLLLSGVMTMSIVSFMSFGVFADDEHPDKTYDTRTYTYNADTGFYEYNSRKLIDKSVAANNGDRLPSGAGLYTLEEDIEVAGGITIDSGNYDVDLNGHTISFNGNSSSDFLFSVSSQGSLTLNSYASRVGTIEAGSPFLLIDGGKGANISNTVIDGGHTEFTSGSDSLIYITNGGYCYIYNNAVIKNGSATKGGAVYVDGAYSTLSLYAGSCIRDCFADEGGAVYSTGRVCMYGTSQITGNIANSKGGAVSIEGDSYLLMNGGSITGNRCKGTEGGGVYLNKKDSIENYSGALCLNGKNGTSNSIIDNLAGDDTQNNVYLANIYEKNRIDFGSNYSAVTNIGVSFDPDLDYEGICLNFMTGDGTNPGISCDDPNKVIGTNGGNLIAIDKPDNGVAIIKGYKLLIYSGYVGIRFYFYFDSSIDYFDATLTTDAIGFDADKAKKAGSPLPDKVSYFDKDTQFPDYYYCDVYVDSAYMTEDIEYEVKYEGNSICTGSITVKDYGDAVLSNSDYRAWWAKTTALLNYGAAAQNYFGVNTDKLANADVENKVTTISDYDKTTKLSSYGPVNVASNDHLSYYGSSLTLKGSLNSNLYFVVGDLEGVDHFDVYVDGVKKHTFNASEIAGRNYCSISVASDTYSDLLKFHVIRVEMDGTELMKFNYSAGQYLYSFYANESSKDAKLVELVNCLYALKLAI